MIFQRYSSPIIFLDNLILTQQLSKFISEIGRIKFEEELQEYFLFKVWDKTYTDFKDEVMADVMNQKGNVPVKAILEDSLGILEKGGRR